jgi:hypothetical protein
MCRLCNAWISQGSTWLAWQRANCNGRIVTTSPQWQLMWLGGWKLLTHVTHSYDLPRSNMAQQHPGGGGYKVEPGVPPNAGDHESVSWHTFPSLLCSVIISIGSLRNERLSHGCMVCIESDSGLAGTSIASRTASANFDPRVCRVAAIIVGGDTVLG